MSRVTINDIHNDVVYSANWSQVCDTEIVPRKIVEMIIEKCIETQRDNDSNDDLLEIGYWGMVEEIKEYAESLLKQFEEDE